MKKSNRKFYSFKSLLTVAVLTVSIIVSCKKNDSAPVVANHNRLVPVSRAMLSLPSTLSEGLIAFWPLSNTAYDFSGNGNTGTSSSVTSTTDQQGHAASAYSFNGTSSYISVPDAVALRLDSDFTISAWVKPTAYNTSYGSAILSKRGSGANNGWCWTLAGNTGTVTAGLVVFGPGTGTEGVGSTVVGLNAWHMVTCLYSHSSKNLSIYVDGTLDSTTANVSQANATATATLYIGRDNPAISDNGYFFTGSICNIRMYNRQITTTEITALYNATTAPTSGIVAYWPLTKTANDFSGNSYNGTASNVTYGTDRFGNPNGASYFNGTSSSISVADATALRLDSNFTINAWVNIVSYNSSYGSAILSKRGSGANNGWCWTLAGNTGTISAGLVVFGPGTGTEAVGATIIGKSAWHMVTCVYSHSTGNLLIYVDGTLDSTTTGVSQPNALATASLYIGRDNPAVSDNGYFFNGYLNDIRMYNLVLSSTQIGQLYNALD